MSYWLQKTEGEEPFLDNHLHPDCEWVCCVAAETFDEALEQIADAATNLNRVSAERA